MFAKKEDKKVVKDDGTALASVRIQCWARICLASKDIIYFSFILIIFHYLLT
jgi:hypothetical protein